MIKFNRTLAYVLAYVAVLVHAPFSFRNMFLASAVSHVIYLHQLYVQKGNIQAVVADPANIRDVAGLFYCLLFATHPTVFVSILPPVLVGGYGLLYHGRLLLNDLGARSYALKLDALGGKVNFKKLMQIVASIWCIIPVTLVVELVMSSGSIMTLGMYLALLSLRARADMDTRAFLASNRIGQKFLEYSARLGL
jgi:hypothetical protein